MARINKIAKVITIRELFQSGKFSLDEKIIVTKSLTPSFEIGEEPENIGDFEDIVSKVSGCGGAEVDNTGQLVFYSGVAMDEKGYICEIEEEAA